MLQGAVQDASHRAQNHGAKFKARQRSTNFAAMCCSLVVPWLLFVIMYSVMSFSAHFYSKAVCYSVVILGLLVSLVFVKSAIDSVKKHSSDPEAENPTLAVFLAVTCVLAWLLGVFAGDLNYFYHMQPYYDASGLDVYSGKQAVDPSRMPGQQVMDFGIMTFVIGSKLDFAKATAFHSHDTFCVAPVINSNVKEPPASYDFWAAGMNCCSGDAGSFACGEFNNEFAMSGLRVMRQDHRDYYRLAVKQAESANNIKANHPLFFHWMQDPQLEIQAYQDEGTKFFLLGVFAFFSLILFLLIATLVLFS